MSQYWERERERERERGRERENLPYSLRLLSRTLLPASFSSSLSPSLFLFLSLSLSLSLIHLLLPKRTTTTSRMHAPFCLSAQLDTSIRSRVSKLLSPQSIHNRCQLLLRDNFLFSLCIIHSRNARTLAEHQLTRHKFA